MIYFKRKTRLAKREANKLNIPRPLRLVDLCILRVSRPHPGLPDVVARPKKKRAPNVKLPGLRRRRTCLIYIVVPVLLPWIRPAAATPANDPAAEVDAVQQPGTRASRTCVHVYHEHVYTCIWNMALACSRKPSCKTAQEVHKNSTVKQSRPTAAW